MSSIDGFLQGTYEVLPAAFGRTEPVDIQAVSITLVVARLVLL